jgi:large subunit ribosomal protein L28
VLRSMEKEGKKTKGGSLDDYLIKGKSQRIKDLGPAGWKLRWLVMQTPAMRARFAAEREKLGVALDESVGEEDERRARELLVLATDYMTPGPLSRRSRDILAARAALAQESFEGDGEGEMEVEGLEFAESEDVVDGAVEGLSGSETARSEQTLKV